MQKTILFLTTLLVGLSAQAQKIQGDWKGALKVGGSKLTIVLHLADGKCTMDSPDQNAKGIQAQELYNENDSIAVEIKMLGAKYCAKLTDGKLVGTFSQRGMSFPLEMTKGEIARNRPQTPQPPFPYLTEELTFTNDLDGAKLAGTLTLPKDAKNPPLVVMVSGSGQQNRDEELFDHKPFAVIADRLARVGIASFRYDDRGIGGSDGLRPDLTTEDFRRDALCAVRMLREKGISKRIGILGHSEGGLIAFMIAGDEPKALDFVISLAGTAISGEKVLLGQIKKAAEAQGVQMTDAQAKTNMQMAAQQNAWYKFFLAYDPTEAIRKITCPVLALFCLPRTKTVADLVREVKSSATAWYKQRLGCNFLWQQGYGAFSVSQSKVETVRSYIAGQEEHHRRRTFQDEYREFLETYGITYDERYVWD